MLFNNDETKIYKEQNFEILKTSVKSLFKKYLIKNYSRNRPPDMVRVAFLENFYTLNDVFLVPQMISAWKKDDTLYIYDGIHRLSAAANLLKTKNMQVIIKIFTKNDESKVIQDFKEINSAVCVPWLYMEEDNKIKKMVCESVVDKLIIKFKHNVSHSRNCQKQNFNRDNMVELISCLNIDFNKDRLDNTIYNQLLNLNLLAKEYIKENNIKTPKKCDYYGFWLGYLPREEIINRIEKSVLVV